MLEMWRYIHVYARFHILQYRFICDLFTYIGLRDGDIYIYIYIHVCEIPHFTISIHSHCLNCHSMARVSFISALWCTFSNLTPLDPENSKVLLTFMKSSPIQHHDMRGFSHLLLYPMCHTACSLIVQLNTGRPPWRYKLCMG